MCASLSYGYSPGHLQRTQWLPTCSVSIIQWAVTLFCLLYKCTPIKLRSWSAGDPRPIGRWCWRELRTIAPEDDSVFVFSHFELFEFAFIHIE